MRVSGHFFSQNYKITRTPRLDTTRRLVTVRPHLYLSSWRPPKVEMGHCFSLLLPWKRLSCPHLLEIDPDWAVIRQVRCLCSFLSVTQTCFVFPRVIVFVMLYLAPLEPMGESTNASPRHISACVLPSCNGCIIHEWYASTCKLSLYWPHTTMFEHY